MFRFPGTHIRSHNPSTAMVPHLPHCAVDFLFCSNQNDAQAHLFPTIPATIKRTWAQEGPRGFFRGLGTNLVRVLPGTCVTFVVYENLAWLLRTTAARRAALEDSELLEEGM